MESLNKDSVVKRWKSSTPKFWKKIQRAGVIIGGLGATILAAPIAIPAALTSIAGYLVLAGSLTATLSQLTVEDKKVLD
jgi:hypothetical protein